MSNSSSCSVDSGVSDKAPVPSTSQELCASETIGHIFSTSLPIVEAILSSLTIKELNTCAQVCKLWNTVARKVKQSRLEISWCFHLTIPFPEVHEGDEHIEVCDETACYVSNSTDDVGWHYYDVVDNSPCEPDIAFILVTERVSFKPQRFFMDYEEHCRRKRKRSRKTTDSLPMGPFYTSHLMTHLAKSLPKKCFGIFCSAPGLIGTPVFKNAPVEAEHTEGICGLFLPKIPGVQFYPFSIMQSDASKWKTTKHTTRQEFESRFENITRIPAGTNMKSLVLLVHDLFKRKCFLANIVDHFVKDNPRISFGGSVLDELSAYRNEDSHNDDFEVCIGLAIAGDKVECASIILDPHVRGEEAVEEKLLELKNCNLPLKNAICFMFACCGRGAAFHNKNNVEAEAFHKLFPRVPLFGIFGNGELGRNCLYKYNKTSSVTLEANPKKEPFKYEFSTVFLLISFLYDR